MTIPQDFGMIPNLKRKEEEVYKKSVSVERNAFFEPLVGFEPTTPRLQITCSGQLS